MNRKGFYLFLVWTTCFFNNAVTLTVTEPSSGITWNLHSSNVVEWQSVSTDPESVEIRIVNNNPAAFGTGFSKKIKDGINTAANKYTIDSLPGCKAAKGYQINIMSTAGTILAQSAQFAINGTSSTNATTTSRINTPNVAGPNLSVSAPTAAASSGANVLKLPEKIVSGAAISCLCISIAVGSLLIN